MSPDLLEEFLTETRPRPDEAWARELDERVQRGFPRESRRRAWLPRLALPSRPSRLVPALGGLAAVLIALVVGASILSGGSDLALRGDDSAVSEDAAGGGSVAAPVEEPGTAGLAVPESLRDERLVERSAALTLTAPESEIAPLGDRVIAVVDRLGGFVASSSVTSTEGVASGSFELRVPVGRLDRAMADLSRLAHVSERSQSTQDVTATFDAAKARARELRAERAGLLRRLSRAEDDAAADAIRARLRLVSAQLAAARREAAQVERRAALATVHVALVADDASGAAAPGDDGAWTPADALRDAIRVLEVAAGVLILALAVALPALLLGLPAAMALRRLTRRRRESALDATA